MVRAAKIVGGFLLLVAGIAMLALPGPGWAAILAALAILATEFVWARRALDRIKSTASSAKQEWSRRVSRRGGRS